MNRLNHLLGHREVPATVLPIQWVHIVISDQDIRPDQAVLSNADFLAHADGDMVPNKRVIADPQSRGIVHSIGGEGIRPVNSDFIPYVYLKIADDQRQRLHQSQVLARMGTT